MDTCSVGDAGKTGCFSGFCGNRPENFRTYGLSGRKKSGILWENGEVVAIAGTYVHYITYKNA